MTGSYTDRGITGGIEGIGVDFHQTAMRFSDDLTKSLVNLTLLNPSGKL